MFLVVEMGWPWSKHKHTIVSAGFCRATASRIHCEGRCGERVCVCVVVRNVNVWHAHTHTCKSPPRPPRVASPSWLPQLMSDSSIMSVAHSFLGVWWLIVLVLDLVLCAENVDCSVVFRVECVGMLQAGTQKSCVFHLRLFVHKSHNYTHSSASSS